MSTTVQPTAVCESSARSRKWIRACESSRYAETTAKQPRWQRVSTRQAAACRFRWMPIYASWAGARVTEIPVEHHARTMGKSKYGLSRTLKVVFDLMTIKFMASYQTKPIYVFGSFGMLAFAISLLAGLYALFLKVI